MRRFAELALRLQLPSSRRLIPLESALARRVWQQGAGCSCPAPCCQYRLPNHLQRKLNLTHIHLGLSERTEIRSRSSVPGQRLQVISNRGCVVNAIHYVEELGPELDIE